MSTRHVPKFNIVNETCGSEAIKRKLPSYLSAVKLLSFKYLHCRAFRSKDPFECPVLTPRSVHSNSISIKNPKSARLQSEIFYRHADRIRLKCWQVKKKKSPRHVPVPVFLLREKISPQQSVARKWLISSMQRPKSPNELPSSNFKFRHRREKAQAASSIIRESHLDLAKHISYSAYVPTILRSFNISPVIFLFD